jgi:hypothetical protein
MSDEQDFDAGADHRDADDSSGTPRHDEPVVNRVVVPSSPERPTQVQVTPVLRDEGWSDAPTSSPNHGITESQGATRIPLDDLTTVNGHDDRRSGSVTEAHLTVRESPVQRAIVWVPGSWHQPAIDFAQPVDVWVHLHGNNPGYRTTDGNNVRDELHDHVAAQLIASGRHLVVAMPQGYIVHSGGSGMPSFGGHFAPDAFAREVLRRLQLPYGLAAAPTLGRVILSGHSGGNLVAVGIERARATQDQRTLVLFDGVHHGQLGDIQSFVRGRLDRDWSQLRTLSTDDDRLAYLTTRGFQFRAYYSDDPAANYGPDTRAVRDTIDQWFSRHDISSWSEAARLRFAENYRVVPSPHTLHEDVVDSGNHNLQTALQSLRFTGLAPPPPPPVTVPENLRLSTDGATLIQTSRGRFYRYPSATRVMNSTDRPHFIWPRSAMVSYNGPGSAPGMHVHPVMLQPLTDLMTMLIAEGERIDDESLKQAVIGSAHRTLQEDGDGYLRELRSQIAAHPDVYPAFPEALESEARSNLGSSSAHSAFVAHLGAAEGWTPALASRLVSASERYKAPAGTSPHESGLAVDINFYYATDRSHVQQHDETRQRNADASLSAAGQWLAAHARDFHFAHYDSEAEIWHIEFLAWRNTAADPDGGPART